MAIEAKMPCNKRKERKSEINRINVVFAPTIWLNFIKDGKYALAGRRRHYTAKRGRLQ